MDIYVLPDITCMAFVSMFIFQSVWGYLGAGVAAWIQFKCLFLSFPVFPTPLVEKTLFWRGLRGPLHQMLFLALLLVCLSIYSWKKHAFLKIIVDIQYYFISFRYTVQWLDIYIILQSDPQ